MDLTTYKLKVDHFEGIHGFGEEVEKIEGAPNFRQVAGFPVYGSAQPTEGGFKKVMEKLPKGTTEKPIKTIWYNMRLEPVVYINGEPHAPRHPTRMHEDLSLEASVSELDKLEREFAAIIKDRAAAEPELRVSHDAGFTENPMERENVEGTVHADSVKGLWEVMDGLNIQSMRVPIIEETCPKEVSFDILVDSLKQEPAATQCAFSCQAGRGRTTLGMVVACLVKEIQITTELRKMAEMGLIPKDTAEDLVRQKFEFPLATVEDGDDTLMKGEFMVILELLSELPGAREGKAKVDRVIDLCGPSPRGSGLQNMREAIVQTKWKYDLAMEDKQECWKKRILSFMERYFYLICFSTYAKEFGPSGFEKSFVSWMDEHSELRKMIEEGRDQLEWYRTVDPAKLRTVQAMIQAPNYKENMAQIVKTILEFAFLTYSDLPKGPIKGNSMKKLAAKTLLEILPPDLLEPVQQRLQEDKMSPDLVTVLSLVSFYCQLPEAAA